MPAIIPDPLDSSTTLPANAGAVSDAAADRSSDGVTTIKDSVIAKVAGLAVREVAGVHSIGTVPHRALGAILETIGNADAGQGITVNIDDDKVGVQIVLVAGYPVPLSTLADQVRASVVLAIERLVGMTVTAVDVTITDIYVAEETSDNDVD